MHTRNAVAAVSAFGLAALLTGQALHHSPVLADQPAKPRAMSYDEAGCATTSAMRFNPCADLDTSSVTDLRGVNTAAAVDLDAVAGELLSA